MLRGTRGCLREAAFACRAVALDECITLTLTRRHAARDATQSPAATSAPTARSHLVGAREF